MNVGFGFGILMSVVLRYMMGLIGIKSLLRKMDPSLTVQPVVVEPVKVVNVCILASLSPSVNLQILGPRLNQ